MVIRVAMHPLDRKCFYQFINAAHSYQRTLEPAGFRAHLLAGGVPTDVADRLSQEYQLGREVLACRPRPWASRPRGGE